MLKEIFKSKLGLLLSVVMMLVMSSLASTTPAYAYEDTQKKVIVHYFYMKPCETCHDEEDFIKHFYEVIGEEAKGIDIELKLHNTFQPENSNLLKNFISVYKVSKETQLSQNILFIGSTYITDDKDFNKRLKEEFIKAKNTEYQSLEKFNNAGTEAGNPVNTSDYSSSSSLRLQKGSDTLIVYFYVSPCSACEEVDKFIRGLKDRYQVDRLNQKINSKVQMKKFNVGELKNLELARKYFEAYKVPKNRQQVPMIFIGDSYLQGKEEIQTTLIDKVEAGKGLSTLELKINGAESGSMKESFSGYEAVGVFLTGLINGLNPCSLSMLLFFISMIAVKNVSVLKLGSAYIAGKFISYFLLGTLFFNILGKINGSWFTAIQSVMKALLLIITVFLIFLNLRDFTAAKNERYGKIKLQLPAALRRLNHNWIKKISLIENSRLLILVSFGLGLLISAGEFLCTGQIYLATIIYVLKTSTVFNLRAAVYFIFYGIALVIPLLLLTVSIHKGREVFDISELVREKIHIVKLVNAAIFLLFALIVIFLF